MNTVQTEVAVLGGGCFWCTEAVFEQLRGVVSVMPGYAGGETPNPTYDHVSSATTGHAEVIRVEFDPAQISYRDLLTVFFASHDPTTPNQQGTDVGPQYRSLILTTNESQRAAAEQFMAELEETSPAGGSIVTEIKPLDEFYEAEEEHRNFYAKNPEQGYCQLVINPKLTKVQQQFSELLKSHT